MKTHIFTVSFLFLVIQTFSKQTNKDQDDEVNKAFKGMSENCFHKVSCEECANSFHSSFSGVESTVFDKINITNPLTNAIESSISSTLSSAQSLIFEKCNEIQKANKDSPAYSIDPNSRPSSATYKRDHLLFTNYSGSSNSDGVFLTTLYTILSKQEIDSIINQYPSSQMLVSSDDYYHDDDVSSASYNSDEEEGDEGNRDWKKWVPSGYYKYIDNNKYLNGGEGQSSMDYNGERDDDDSSDTRRRLLLTAADTTNTNNNNVVPDDKATGNGIRAFEDKEGKHILFGDGHGSSIEDVMKLLNISNISDIPFNGVLIINSKDGVNKNSSGLVDDVKHTFGELKNQFKKSGEDIKDIATDSMKELNKSSHDIKNVMDESMKNLTSLGYQFKSKLYKYNKSNGSKSPSSTNLLDSSFNDKDLTKTQKEANDDMMKSKIAQYFGSSKTINHIIPLKNGKVAIAEFMSFYVKSKDGKITAIEEISNPSPIDDNSDDMSVLTKESGKYFVKPFVPQSVFDKSPQSVKNTVDSYWSVLTNGKCDEMDSLVSQKSKFEGVENKFNFSNLMNSPVDELNKYVSSFLKTSKSSEEAQTSDLSPSGVLVELFSSSKGLSNSYFAPLEGLFSPSPSSKESSSIKGLDSVADTVDMEKEITHKHEKKNQQLSNKNKMSSLLHGIVEKGIVLQKRDMNNNIGELGLIEMDQNPRSVCEKAKNKEVFKSNIPIVHEIIFNPLNKKGVATVSFNNPKKFMIQSVNKYKKQIEKMVAENSKKNNKGAATRRLDQSVASSSSSEEFKNPIEIVDSNEKTNTTDFDTLSDKLTKAIKDVAKLFKDKVEAGSQKVQEKADAVNQAVKDEYKYVAQQMRNKTDMALGKVDDMSQSAKKDIDVIQSEVNQTEDTAKSNIEKAGDKIKEAFQSFSNKLKQYIDSGSNWVEEMQKKVRSAGGSISNYFGDLKKKMSEDEKSLQQRNAFPKINVTMLVAADQFKFPIAPSQKKILSFFKMDEAEQKIIKMVNYPAVSHSTEDLLSKLEDSVESSTDSLRISTGAIFIYCAFVISVIIAWIWSSIIKSRKVSSTEQTETEVLFSATGNDLSRDAAYFRMHDV